MTTNIPVESADSSDDIINVLTDKINSLSSLSDEEDCFITAINYLSSIKIACGGQALYGTLRKRKILKRFLDSYIRNKMVIKLDDLEERIASLK